MKIGTEDKKKLILAGAFGFCALIASYFLYQDFFGGPPQAALPQAPVIKTVASPVAGVNAAEKVGTTSAKLDPTLHMEAMRVTESLIYSGSGRNIFAAGSAQEPAPIKIAAAIAPARPNSNLQHGPVAPQGPPPLPPINLKFFGTATRADGSRIAFLLNGDDVYTAAVGDVVQRRYRVVSIAMNAIMVEDIPNSNKQSLPLIPN